MTAEAGHQARLRELAAWMLPGAPAIGAIDGPGQAAALVAGAQSARLLGPLLLAVDARAVDLPQDAVEVLLRHHLQVQQWSVLLEARLLEVRDWFAAAGGIRHLVVKGPAVAHLDELDPALRSFADLDVLVARDDLDRAVAALQVHGATRPWAERRPGFDRRFAKSVTLTCPDGVEVDLHRSLCDGVHGFRIPLPRLFVEPDHFELGGERIATLAPVHRLLHAAYHAVLGSPVPRLMSLRDLGGYLARGDLGPDAVVAELRRWRGEAVLATAVTETAETLGVAFPAWQAWARSGVVTPKERRILERQRREGSAFGPAKVDLRRELHGIRPRLGYGLALAMPSTAHLRSRGRRRRDLLRPGGRSPRR